MIFKKLEVVLVFLLLIIFFIVNANIINYGLPFFLQEDENAFLKSTISFISYITGIKGEMSDPFFAPLINLFLSGNFLFLNEFVLNSLSFEEIKLKVYNDPSILIVYGRYNSLLISTFCLFFLYLIFKKLKIKFVIYFPILISLSFSLFMTPIALVNGKNSFYLFFFLLQLYFFIKYFLKLEKFNKNTYFLFAILSSAAWGINYWSSIVSIYGILILHYRKFKLKNYSYILSFIVIFVIFGLLPSLLFEDYFFLNFFLRESQGSIFPLLPFLNNIFDKISFTILIIFHTEIFMLVFISIFIFYMLKNFKNKKMVIILTILIFEPILIFALAGDEVIPELRYFSGLICLMFILSTIIIKDLLNYYKSKYIVLIFALVNIGIVTEKVINYVKLNNVISANHTFIDFYEKNSTKNHDIIYLIPGLDSRKNLKNLNLYKNLHEKNIITNKLFQKDNYNSIQKKIQIEKKSDFSLKNEKILDLNLFNIHLFEIKNYDLFFIEIKNNYNFVSIQESALVANTLNKYIKSNYKKVDETYNQEGSYYNNGLRDVIKFLYNGGSAKKLENFKLGNNYSLYSLK